MSWGVGIRGKGLRLQGVCSILCFESREFRGFSAERCTVALRSVIKCLVGKRA